MRLEALSFSVRASSSTRLYFASLGALPIWGFKSRKRRNSPIQSARLRLLNVGTRTVLSSHSAASPEVPIALCERGIEAVAGEFLVHGFQRDAGRHIDPCSRPPGREVNRGLKGPLAPRYADHGSRQARISERQSQDRSREAPLPLLQWALSESGNCARLNDSSTPPPSACLNSSLVWERRGDVALAIDEDRTSTDLLGDTVLWLAPVPAGTELGWA
jgi:hypothetical protein